MVSPDDLSPAQYKLMLAARFLRTLPLDYASTNLDPNYERRMLIHARIRETFRIIWSGEASIFEHNSRIQLIRDFKREKAARDSALTRLSSLESSSESSDLAV